MIEHRHPAPRDPARVVILGARGFIAQHLLRWCEANGIPVRAVSSAEIDLADTANAGRLAALLQPEDAIVMTSSLTPDKGRDYRTLMANIRMAETVCTALEKAACAHVVYLSSDAVYDARNCPLYEESSREPVDLYGLSHTVREMMLGQALKERGIPLGVLRLTALFGPGDTHNAYGPNRFFRSALRDRRIELFGNGEERRSHVYIDDAIALIGLALRHCSEGTVNIAVNDAISFRQVADCVNRLLGGSVEIASKPRATPMIHREFSNAVLAAAFPGFRFTEFGQALAAFISKDSAALSVALPQ